MTRRSGARIDLTGPLPDFLTQVTEGAGVYAVPSGGQVRMICDYAAGRQVLNAAEFSRSEAIKPDYPKLNDAEPVEHSIMSMDGEDHARLRRIVAGAFTARRTAEMAPRIDHLTTEHLDRLAISGPPADIMSALAKPLPLAVLCELLGIPPRDSEPFKDCVEVLFDISDGVAGKTRRKLELVRYVTRIIRAKRMNPDDDLLSSLIGAQERGELSQGELVTMALTLLMAGYETTTGQVGLAVLCLLAHPAAYQALVRQPDLIPGAVEETLRLNPATPVSFARVATRPVRIDGIPIAAGETVMVSMMHGNRDEQVFPASGELRLGGRDPAHLTFGHGVHHCLGAPLARLQMRIILGQLTERFPGLRLANCPEPVMWKDGLATRGLNRLMVEWLTAAHLDGYLVTWHPYPGRSVLRVCLILSTGRCGGTMLSNIVREHREMLSISELFSALRGHDLTDRELSGTEFWDMLSTPGQAEAEVLMRCRIRPNELLYPAFRPRPGASRFSGDMRMPPLMQVTIPHLADRPDDVYANLESMAAGQPRRMLSDHLRWLFSELAGSRGPQVVVERSGGSLGYGAALLRLFPEAKIVHLYRDGRECAVSMSRHACFKLAAIRSMLTARLGYDPYAATDAAKDARRGLGPRSPDDELLGLVPDLITRDRFDNFHVPLGRYGGMWSLMVAVGLTQLPEASRVLHLDYKDVLAKPLQSVGMLLEFLGIAHDSEWERRVSSGVGAGRDVRGEVTRSEWDELGKICSLGMNRIYGRRGWRLSRIERSELLWRTYLSQRQLKCWLKYQKYTK